MDNTEEIIINFSEEQQEVIMKKCGFVPKPIVTNSLSLVMLSLAAKSKKSLILPLVNRISTAHIILENREENLSVQQPYTVILELTEEQRRIISDVVNQDWHKVIIVPDDYEIRYRENWESEPLVQKIGKSLVIVSESAGYSALSNQAVIKLPAINDSENHTFGTGSHPTTQTMLILLEKYLKAGFNVLDIGTGSGILAVAAAKLGAKKVFAVDVNDAAVETARKMVELNNVSEFIKLDVGSIEIVADKYDLVTANLFPQIIISMAKSLADKVNPNGLLLLSGLVSERIPEIIRVIEAVGFEHLEAFTIDIWGGLAFLKKE